MNGKNIEPVSIEALQNAYYGPLTRLKVYVLRERRTKNTKGNNYFIFVITIRNIMIL